MAHVAGLLGFDALWALVRRGNQEEVLQALVRRGHQEEVLQESRAKCEAAFMKQEELTSFVSSTRRGLLKQTNEN